MEKQVWIEKQPCGDKSQWEIGERKYLSEVSITEWGRKPKILRLPIVGGMRDYRGGRWQIGINVQKDDLLLNTVNITLVKLAV